MNSKKLTDVDVCPAAAVTTCLRSSPCCCDTVLLQNQLKGRRFILCVVEGVHEGGESAQQGLTAALPNHTHCPEAAAVACLLVLRRLLTGHSVPAASPPQSLLVLTPSPQHDPSSWVKLPESFLLFPTRTLIQRTETLPPLPCPPRRPHSWSLVLCPGLCFAVPG